MVMNRDFGLAAAVLTVLALGFVCYIGLRVIAAHQHGASLTPFDTTGSDSGGLEPLPLLAKPWVAVPLVLFTVFALASMPAIVPWVMSKWAPPPSGPTTTAPVPAPPAATPTKSSAAGLVMSLRSPVTEGERLADQLVFELERSRHAKPESAASPTAATHEKIEQLQSRIVQLENERNTYFELSTSGLNLLKCGIQAFQLHTGVGGREVPVGLGVVGISA